MLMKQCATIRKCLKIAQALDFPTEYFMSEDLCTVTTGNTYFRSQASAAKKSRNAQKVKLEYVSKMYEVLLNYMNVPELNLPNTSDIHIPDTVVEADSDEAFEEIEKLASCVRECWDLG